MEEAMNAIDLVGGYIVGEPDIGRNVIKAALMIPLASGEAIPARLALHRDGRVEAITTDGTYEVGVEALTQLVESIQAEGIEIDEISFETHSHEHQAPMQSYSQVSEY